MHLRHLTTPVATVPTISTAAMLSHEGPENEALRELLRGAEQPDKRLQGKRIAVLVTDGVEEVEITIPLHVLRARGATVEILSPREGPTLEKMGLISPDQRKTHILTVRFMENAGWLAFDRTIEDADVRLYDAVFVPGGAWNPDTLRTHPAALAFLQAAHAAGKILATICHGPWVFINAGLLKGRKATGYGAILTDIRNAGATVLDQPVVIDGNLITSRYPLDLPEMIEALTGALLKAQ